MSSGHVSKNKVFETSVTEGELRGSLKISRLEKKWCWRWVSSSFLVRVSLGLVMVSEADEGSSSRVSEVFWSHQMIFTLGWCQSSWCDDGGNGDEVTTHFSCYVSEPVCSVCICSCVCVLCMRGVWAGSITRPLCTEHQRLSGWAVWPVKKDRDKWRLHWHLNR